MHDADEPLAVLDAEGMPTGEVKPRSEVHRDGDWHRAFHLWIVNADGYVLLQRRSRSKDLAGGKVDVSVAGHLRVGETILDAVREAEEEVGLVVRPGDLAFLGTIASERVYSQDADGIDAIDREHQDVYAVRCDWPLERYTLDCGEVDVLYEIPLAAALQYFRDGGHVPVAGHDCMDRVNNALLVPHDRIEQALEGTLRSLAWLQAWHADPDAWTHADESPA